MNKLTYKLPEGDLASRSQAIPHRHEIEKLYLEGFVIEIDLFYVNSISESYSDEIFGVLVAKYGLDNVLNHIKIKNTSTSILRSIAKVMQRRYKENLSRNFYQVNFDATCAVC